MKYDEILEYLYDIHAKSDISLESMAEDLEEKEPEWILCDKKQPDENGKYLVVMKVFAKIKIGILSYAKNLSLIDSYDFAQCDHAGWYDYDWECGFYEKDSPIAWMPIPKYKEE